MHKKIEHARIILRMLYESLFTVLLISFLSLFFLKVPLAAAAVGILMFFFCISYIVRTVFFNKVIVFGIHILLLAGCYYLPYRAGVRILMAGVVIFLIRDALLFMAREGKVTPLVGAPWPTLLLSFAIYLFALYYRDSVFLAMAYLIPVFLIVLYYMMSYVEGLFNYYLSTRDTKEATMRRIVSTNSIVIGIILIVFFIGIFIGNVHFVHSIVEKLVSILSECLRIIILAAVFLLSQFIPAFTFSEEEQLTKDGKIVRQIEDTSDTPLLWIAYLIVGVVLLWILYSLLKRFILFLLSNWDLSKEGENGGKSAVIEVESIRPVKRNRVSSSVHDKRRRYYRRRILRYMSGKKISDKYSCRDIAKIIKEEQHEDINQLTEYYARIRYGSEDVDRQLTIGVMKKLNREGRG